MKHCPFLAAPQAHRSPPDLVLDFFLGLPGSAMAAATLNCAWQPRQTATPCPDAGTLLLCPHARQYTLTTLVAPLDDDPSPDDVARAPLALDEGRAAEYDDETVG